MGFPASDLRKLRGLLNALDGSDGVDVATSVATADSAPRLPTCSAVLRIGYRVRGTTSAEIIEEIRIRISRAVPPDSRVILFGSRVRDEADDGSDYDVLVIERKVEDRAREAVRLRRELGDVLAPIDVVVDRELARRPAGPGHDG